MKKIFRILGVCIILVAIAILALRGVMGISFVMGEKTFYPPAGHFLTPNTRNFNFIVLSDTGSQNTTLERLINDSRLKYEPEFMLHLGDLVVHRNIEHMYWMMDELDNKLDGIPLYLVPGNHDVKKKRGIDKSMWNRVFGPAYYWFGYGNTLFVGLDSSSEEIDDEQWTFYENVMKSIRPRFKYVVLFTHVPPVVPEGAHDHTLKPEHIKKMGEMLRKYPVSAIFCGHLHYYSKQNFQGIPIYTVPPSGQYFGGPVHKFGYLNVVVDNKGIHVEPVHTDHKKASEWGDIFFVDLVLSNKVRWLAGIVLLVGVIFLLSGQKWLRFSWLKRRRD